jgi:hypothetical protein
MPCSFLPVTSSLTLAMTRSAPTPYGSSVTVMLLLPRGSTPTSAVARIRTTPRPVSYAARTSVMPSSWPPVGRSGPGTKRISSSRVASGCESRCRAASTTSTRLCGIMLVAIPTAIPDVPLTSRFGIAAGSTDGCCSEPS